MIKNKLQIVLITYNRIKYLQKTFNQILADNSPIRDYDIIVLDNASTDGTSELIDRYCAKFPNLRHIRHKINIGGNANICRAFEIGASSGKEYVWVLCDDDVYDFSNWNAVEKEIANKTDIITVANYVFPNKECFFSKYHLLFQLTFVPAGIFRTDLITDSVLMNMYDAIYTMFSQACITISAINKNKKMKVLDNWIVDNGLHYEDPCKELSYSRGSKAKTIKRRTDTLWLLGYSNVLSLLDNQNDTGGYMNVAVVHPEICGSWEGFIRYCIDNYRTFERFNYLIEIINVLDNEHKNLIINAFREHYADSKNVDEVFCLLPDKKDNIEIKKTFFEKIFSIKNNIHKTQKIVTILGLEFKKDNKVFKKSYLEQIFSIKNSSDKVHKIITFLGIEIKFKKGKNI